MPELDVIGDDFFLARRSFGNATTIVVVASSDESQVITRQSPALRLPSRSPPSATSNNSTFWPNGGFRKRKAAVTDLDEK